MADHDVDEQKLLDNARKLPASEQLSHKNWKVRQQLYDTIKDVCTRAESTDDAQVSQFGSLFAKAVADSNAAAQDRAMEALNAYLAIATEATASTVAEACCHHIVSKALKGRASTVKLSSDVFVSLVELEQQATVVEALIKGLSDKVPKVVVAAIDILASIVTDFGAKVVSPAPIIKALPPLFGHKDGKVVLAQWTSAATIKTAVCEKMPDAMKKEVEKEIDDLPKGKPTAARTTRKHAAQQPPPPPSSTATAAAPAAGPAATFVDDEDDGVDAYDLVEPSDVLNSLGKDFWKELTDAKWTIRKGALQHLKALASQPRLAAGDYHDLLRELRKIVTKDSNVVCQAETVACYAALARGLRKEFSTPARQLASVLLDKLKEKNAGVTAACRDALDVMHRYCFSLCEVAEDMAGALEHKNPKVRVDTLQLMAGMVQREPREAIGRVLATLGSPLVKNAMEASPDLRDAAMLVLTACAVRLGKLDKVLTKHTDKMDDTRQKRLADLVQQALASGSLPDVTSNAGMLTARGPRPPAIATTATRDAAGESATTASRGSSASGTPASRGGPATGRRAPAAPAAKPTVKDAAAKEAQEEPPLSSEDAVAQLGQLVGEATVVMLSDADWKQRKAGMDAVLVAVKGSPDNTLAAGVVVQALSSVPGWGEKNFQVLQLVFETIAHLAAHNSSVGRREVVVAMAGLHDKAADVKLKTAVGETLTALSEAVGPGFVAGQLHSKAAVHKNPKVLSESLLWIAGAVDDFGLAAMDVKQLVEWVKSDLGSTAPATRTAATSLVVAMHRQLGGGLVPMLAEHVKPALWATVEAELVKNPLDPSYTPLRSVRKATKAAAVAVGITAVAGTASGRPGTRPGTCSSPDTPPSVDDLLPRTDISGQVTAQLLGMIGSAQPKERMKGVDAVDELLRGVGGRIGPDVGDLLPALKGRLSDSNKNLVAHVLTTLGDLARAMGAPFAQQMRPLVLPALANLNDSKKHVREAVATMLDAWVAVVPADRFLQQLADTVVSAKCSPDGKRVAIAWLQQQVTGTSPLAGADLEPVLRICASAVKDKRSDVRADGEALVAGIATAYSQAEVASALGSLDAPTRTAATESLQRHMTVGAAPLKVAGLREEPTARPLTARGAASGVAPKRAAHSRSAGSHVSSATSGSAIEVGDACLLVVNDRKEDRARRLLPRLRACAGKYEPRLDDPESLESDMQPYVADSLRKMLFHKDFKRHSEAVSLLLDHAADDPASALACLDLLLRWVALRQADATTNTQSLLKILELTRVLLTLLQDAKMELTELEVLVLLPCLIDKSGHNQDRIRAMYRSVIQLSTHVAPVPRVLELLLVGVQHSKNNRSRVEACEEVGSMLEAHGLDITSSLKVKPLPLCAQLVADRDKALRGACLGVLGRAYLELGSGVWRHVGRCTPQQQSLIEERFRALDKQGAGQGARVRPRSSPVQEIIDSPRRDAVRHPSLGGMAATGISPYDGPARLETPGTAPRSAWTGEESPRGGSSGDGGRVHSVFRGRQDSSSSTPLPGQLRGPAHSLPDGRTEAEVEEQWSSGIVMLHADDPVEYSDGMKMINYVLKEAHDGTLGSHVMATLAASANELVLEVNNKLDEVGEFLSSQAVRSAMATTNAQEQKDWARVAKYALNILMLAFPMGAIARSLSLGSLRHTVATALVLLLDDAELSGIFQGEAMLKAMNVMMLKVLENSDKTLAYIALLQLLRAPPAAVASRGPDGAARFSDLLVKCLIKLTKALPVCIDSLDVAQLLCSIHEYFTDLGLEEIRRRGTTDDKPLRMMKTLLHELCKHKGAAIKDCVSLVPRDAGDGEPLILAYIDLNLQTLAAAGLLPTAGNSPQASPHTIAAARAAPTPSRFGRAPATPQATELTLQLASVFGKIADASTAQEGMQELHQLRKAHPELDLEAHPAIASKSPQFRQFVMTGLQAIEQRDAAATPVATLAATAVVASPAPKSGGLLSLGGLQKRMAAFRIGGGSS